MDFRWNEWNVEHLARHGVEPESAEEVVTSVRKPYPHRIGEDKWLALGQDANGNHLQVVFVADEDGTLFVIHARRLTEREKQRLRRQRR